MHTMTEVDMTYYATTLEEVLALRSENAELRKALNAPAQQAPAPAAEPVSDPYKLRKALQAAGGYLTNARIDLTTGAPKATALRTIDGGLKLIKEALDALRSKGKTPKLGFSRRKPPTTFV